MTQIITHTKRMFDLAKPTTGAVDIGDIAFALSHINRFTGHTGHSSVARHSLRVARALADAGESRLTQLAGLMHDAQEAYVGDVSTPLKAMLGPQWAAIERDVRTAVCTRFGLTVDLPEAVIAADKADCAGELKTRFDYGDAPSIELPSYCSSWDDREDFLVMFARLIY